MSSSKILLLALIFTAGAARAQFCPLGETQRKIVTCKASVSMEDCKAEAQKVGCDVVRTLPLIHAVVIEVPEVRAFIAEAKLNANVKIERHDDDGKVRWLHSLPNNDHFGSSPALDELTRHIKELQPKFTSPVVSRQIPWGVQRVGAPQAWPRDEGAGAEVAVIDTGIDASHPDLAGQVLGGVNIVDPKQPNNWKDDEGHGTHVSGTIAASGQNGGIAGVAPRAKLYAVKVLDKDGNGNYDDVIAGIEWAMNHNIKIANMSLGADEGSEPLHRAVQAALAHGMLIIAAAGNTGGSVGYPGAYPEAVAVGASDSADKVANFSSRGPEVDYIAPGVDILSTKLGGGYVALSGTSMASPHLAGLAALAYAAGAHTPEALRAALDRAAKPINGLTPDLEGRGMVLAGDLTPHNGMDAGGATLAMVR